MDLLFSALILLILTVISVYKLKRVNVEKDFMSIRMCNSIKAICSVIVVFVHIPLSHTNAIQNIISSFGYVAVTLFFAFSSYGVIKKIKENSGYLKTFLFKRIILLLIPCVIINLIRLFLSYYLNSAWDFWIILKINDYVISLLILYFIVWIVYSIKLVSTKYKDYLIIALVLVASLLTYFTDINILSIWPVEAIGFIYGIVLYRYFNEIKQWMNSKYLFKLFAFLFISMLLGVVYIKTKHIYFFGEYLFRVFLSSSLVTSLLLICYKVYISNSILDILHKVSFEIYLCHIFVLNFLDKVLEGKIVDYFILLSFIIILFIAFIVSKLSGLITRPIIKKLKL